eukprot:CAMPEP_0185764132 /NCGR_PEP_ID=MMETSP1174-20130828/23047_1 /TAXON_ID=35687 /ORGANISM="Dictyocha speculum, Strain CCMP1381" /LENGTH=267 /DNA_ID=CAMNT_0028446523 /DNA_START=17 /DNA_END=817 /DNA_ORIENTATION=+
MATGTGAGEYWRIPSDHIPVGCKLNSRAGPSLAGLRVVSWNVLNSRFSLNNLASQGMSGSLPYMEYDPTLESTVMGNGLSRRDALVLVTLHALLSPGLHQASVLALQECTIALLDALQPILDETGWEICPAKHSDDTVLLYRSTVLDLEAYELHNDVFKSRKMLLVATLVPKGGEGRLRVVACKIKGTPPPFPNQAGLWIGPALLEWAKFMGELCPDNTEFEHEQKSAPSVSLLPSPLPTELVGTTTVCVSDFNFLASEVVQACLST